MTQGKSSRINKNKFKKDKRFRNNTGERSTARERESPKRTKFVMSEEFSMFRMDEQTIPDVTKMPQRM